MINAKLENRNLQEQMQTMLEGAGRLLAERSRYKSDAVAILEDDRSVRVALGRLIKSASIHVETFASAEEFLHGQPLARAGLSRGRSEPARDGWTGYSGSTFCRSSTRAFIFVSAHCEPWHRSQACQAGAIAFLDKPVNEETLLSTIKAATTK
jgi:FixJ family two-component response regulator